MWHDAVNVRPHYPDGDNNVVFADLEFTGEADGPPHACHVYHIAAVKASDPDNHFNQYIQPMTTDDALQSAHVPATREELATKGAVSAAQAFSQSAPGDLSFAIVRDWPIERFPATAAALDTAAVAVVPSPCDGSAVSGTESQGMAPHAIPKE